MVRQELITALGKRTAFGCGCGKLYVFHPSCGDFLLWYLGNKYTQGESAALSVQSKYVDE